MATSGTTAFDLNIDEVIDEGYERCGLATNSGYDLRSARRSLNLLFAEWGNRGIHLWKVNLNEITLVNGTNEYTTASNVNDVLEAYVSTTSGQTASTQDVSLTKIDRSAFAAMPNKGSTGQPSQYYVQRLDPVPKIFLYITPDASTYTHLKYYSINRIEDAGSYTNQADVAYRFLPCMCAGLAYYLAMKKAPQLVQQNKLVYEDELKRALDEDGQRASTFIAPQTFYPTVS
jgi:hypothetical protein|tara:strand:- start:469 stop:1161 length:693 start_codon:yes stop_codon:yes gene_type:complete